MAQRHWRALREIPGCPVKGFILSRIAVKRWDVVLPFPAACTEGLFSHRPCLIGGPTCCLALLAWLIVISGGCSCHGISTAQECTPNCLQHAVGCVWGQDTGSHPQRGGGCDPACFTITVAIAITVTLTLTLTLIVIITIPMTITMTVTITVTTSMTITMTVTITVTVCYCYYYDYHYYDGCSIM